VTHDEQLQQLLSGQPGLTQEQRAKIYDHFWMDTPVTFARFLHGFIGLPEKLIGELIAGRLTVPWQEPKQVTPEDQVIAAVSTLAKMDPAVLKLAEKHGHISKILVDAALASRD
jgi:hypothetical protein